jgi:hypothetical protein
MSNESSWRPYVAGALTGVLAVLSVYVSTALLDKPKYLGASTSFARAAGMIERQAAPNHVRQNAYYQKTKVKIDWQFMLLVGLFLGSLASSLATKTFKVEAVPPIWRERFGGSVITRMAGGFLGGAVAVFGARMAGGCPSGHGLSGLMQLSVSGFLAMAAFFAAGIIVANLTYKSGR